MGPLMFIVSHTGGHLFSPTYVSGIFFLQCTMLLLFC